MPFWSVFPLVALIVISLGMLFLIGLTVLLHTRRIPGSADAGRDEMDTPQIVASWLSPTEAHLLRNRLQADGVTAVVVDEHFVATDWLLQNAAGGAKVAVPSQSAERARWLIRRYGEQRGSGLDPADPPQGSA